MREVRSDLLERHVQLVGCLGNVNRASGLARELFHPPFGSKRTQVSAVVESCLHYEDLTVVGEHPLYGRLKIVPAGSFHTIRNDHQHSPAIVRTQVSRSVNNGIEERS